MLKLFVLTTAALVLFTASSMTSADDHVTSSPACRSYVTLMRENLMEIAARHFRDTDPEMTEEKYANFFKRDITPTKMFRDRLGSGASSAQFTKFALTLAYADSPVQSGMNGDQLRSKVDAHLVAEELDEAREVIGQLILVVNDIFVQGASDESSVEKRCLTSSSKYAVFQTLVDELTRLKEEIEVEKWEELLGVRPSIDTPYVDDQFFTILGKEPKASSRLSKRSTEETTVKSNKDYVVLMKREYDSSETSVEVNFDVDCTISTILVEATKQCGGMKVFHPNTTEGRPLTWLDDKLELKVESGKRLGEWSIRSNGAVKKGCQIKVSALSTMGFFLTTVEPKKTGSGYQVLHSNPTPYLSLGCLLDFYGLNRAKADTTYVAEQVRLVDNSGMDIIDPINVDTDANGTVSFFLPYGFDSLQSFRVQVEGSNAAGTKFVRTAPKMIEMSSLLIEYDMSEVSIRPGIKVKIPVKVTNYGREDMISLKAWDELQYAILKPGQRKIGQNESKIFNMFIDAPKDTVPGSFSEYVVYGRAKRSATTQSSSSVAVVQADAPLRINSMAITAIINSRFAETTIQTSVTNNHTVVREAELDVLLPVDAFVTNFTMNVDGTLIVGQVEEKKKADKIYNKAKQIGATAGKVGTRQKSERDFRQSMLAAPDETIVFIVTYQQLLYRYDNSYDYSVMLNPNQPIKHLTVDVHIVEESPLDFVKTPGFAPRDTKFDAKSVADEAPEGSVITFSADRRACHVRYSPSIEDQTETSPFGLNGAYSVLYDVSGQDMFGSMSVQNGYFTHFFAARTLPVRPKAVIYIMDVSGSMSGTKMSQARETLRQLIELHDERDMFNVIFFSSGTRVWKDRELVVATPENKQEAIEFVERHGWASGSTNIHHAYHVGFNTIEEYIELLDEEKSWMNDEMLERADRRKNQLMDYWKMICFLTDGMHTTDWKTNDEIAALVKARNNDRLHIHNVAFGSGADYDFMQQISAENNGLTRRIFENMDAAASIRDFFYEVTNVLMTNVKIEYEKEKVMSTSQNEFDYISKGKEVIISGRISEDFIDSTALMEADDFSYKITGKLSGRGSNADMVVDFEIDPFKTSRIASSQHQINQFSERIWAFMRIKKLLDTLKISTLSDEEKNATNAEALELSLKYNFVTPLTSIVVMKDADRQKVVKELLKEEEMKATTTVAPATTTTPYLGGSITTQAPTLTNPVTSGSTGNYGGVYRDPHVVLPLKPGVNLCFNWDGKDHEVHNLIYHPKTGMAVNGMMVAAPAGIKSMNGKDRVYIYSISFIVPLSKANIIVTPNNITIAYYGVDSFTIPVTSKFSISRDGLDLFVYELHGSMVKVQITIDGVQYQLMLHRKSRVPHVDLAFEDLTHKKTSGKLDGVIGQYYGKGVHLTTSEDEEDRAILRIGEELADVKQHMMKANPITRVQEPCWFSANGGQALSKGDQSRFVVDSLETRPKYEAAAPTVTAAATPEDPVPAESDKGLKSHHSVLTALFKEE